MHAGCFVEFVTWCLPEFASLGRGEAYLSGLVSACRRQEVFDSTFCSTWLNLPGADRTSGSRTVLAYVSPRRSSTLSHGVLPPSSSRTRQRISSCGLDMPSLDFPCIGSKTESGRLRCCSPTSFTWPEQSEAGAYQNAHLRSCLILEQITVPPKQPTRHHEAMIRPYVPRVVGKTS